MVFGKSQVLQQETAGNLLVRDKAARHEARGEVEMDCQWGICGRAQIVYVNPTKMKQSSLLGSGRYLAQKEKLAGKSVVRKELGQQPSDI